MIVFADGWLSIYSRLDGTCCFLSSSAYAFSYDDVEPFLPLDWLVNQYGQYSLHLERWLRPRLTCPFVFLCFSWRFSASCLCSLPSGVCCSLDSSSRLLGLREKEEKKKMKSKENEASRMSEKEEKIERSSLIILSSTHPTHYIPHYSMYCNTVLLYVYCSTPFRSTQVHTYLVIYVSVRKKKPNPRWMVILTNHLYAMVALVSTLQVCLKQCVFIESSFICNTWSFINQSRW